MAKKLKFEAGEGSPENAKAIMGISERIQVVIEIIRSMFKDDSMDVTLILRSRIPCEGECTHDGAHGAVFMSDDGDVAKNLILLERMIKTHQDASSGKSAPPGVTILSEREGELN